MNRRAAQPGLTLMELTFALVSLSVLGMAIASLMAATGDAWQTRDDHREQSQAIRTASARITTWVREARRIVTLADDGDRVDLVLWCDDDYFVDGVNLGEIKVISYDRRDATISLYAADLTPAQLGSPSANPAFAPTDLVAGDFVDRFRGRSSVDGYPMLGEVNRAKLTVANGPTTDSPYRFFEGQFSIAGPRGAGDQVALVTAWVRAVDTSIDFGNDGDGDATIVVTATAD